MAGSFLWSSVTEKAVENQYPKWEGVSVGDLVEIIPRRKGVVRYIGETKFAEGVWYGLELFTRTGRHSGKVKGVRYFTAAPKTAVFVPRKKIHKILRRAATIPFHTYMQANAEALDLFNSMLGKWKQAAHHLKHNTAFLDLEDSHVTDLHHATHQLRTALESLQRPTAHVRKRSSSDPHWRDSPDYANRFSMTPGFEPEGISREVTEDLDEDPLDLGSPRSVVSRLSMGELIRPSFDTMSMKRMVISSGVSPRGSKYSTRIVKAVDDDPILLALSKSTRKGLVSKNSLSQVIQELQKCIVLIEKYIPKITNQLNEKQIGDSEVPVYDTHVIQELLKRVQERDDIDSKKIRTDFSSARPVDLENAYDIDNCNLMVEVMGWIRNNITASAVTDEKDAEMASMAAREVQQSLKSILSRLNSRPPSSVFSPQFGSDYNIADLEDRFNELGVGMDSK